MKIAIMGCGATGSVYAGLFASSGHEVWAIDRWAEHIEAMREKGLTVSGASGTRTVPVHATTSPAEAPQCDLVIIATKAMDVADAAEAAKPLIGPDTVVLPIQNGLGSPEQVVRTLGREHVKVGVIGGFGASVQAPGHVHHNGWDLVRLGEIAGPASDRLREIEAVWTDAGFTAKCFDDLDGMIWEKLICNVAFSGPCALTGLTIGQAMADEEASVISLWCAQEAFNVAMALAIDTGIRDPERHIRKFAAKIPDAKPSLLLDHEAGRRSEIDVINGAIPRAGLRVGVQAPVNESVTALVKFRERAFAG